MNGIVSGGWNFVWAAYGISALVLASYCAHVVNAFFDIRAAADRDAEGTAR